MKRIKQLVTISAAILLLASAVSAPAQALTVAAAPNSLAVYIDSRPISFRSYVINNSSYFKLRDLAYALSGTDKQFQVVYDAIKNEIDLTSGEAYTPVGGELLPPAEGESALATPTRPNMTLDGETLNLTTYTIGANNYVKLRDLAAAINFGVDYLPERGAVVIDTTAGYTRPPVALSELKVTMIGDSIGVGVGPYVKKLLPQLDNHSKECRQFYEAKGIVQQLLQSGSLAETVVIELGTNGPIKESDMRALIELMSDRKVVFVNCQLPKAWGVSDNMTIAKVTADYPNTIIADWYSASLDKSGYLYSDKVHPTVTGAKVLAQVIADAVEKIQYV